MMNIYSIFGFFCALSKFSSQRRCVTGLSWTSVKNQDFLSHYSILQNIFD